MLLLINCQNPVITAIYIAMSDWGGGGGEGQSGGDIVKIIEKTLYIIHRLCV